MAKDQYPGGEITDPAQDPDYIYQQTPPTTQALQQAVYAPAMSGPGAVVRPGTMGPLLPGQEYGPTTTQPPPTTTTTAPGPSKAPAKTAKGEVTLDDIRNGLVPGWTLSVNGEPIQSDPSVAQAITFRDSDGKKVKLPGGQGTGQASPKSFGKVGPPAATSDVLATNPNYGTPGMKTQAEMNQAGLGSPEEMARSKAKAAQNAADAANQQAAKQYLQPEDLQKILQGALNPIFDQMNAIAGRLGGAQGQYAHGLAQQQQQALPVKSALAYLQNLPTQSKSAQTASTSDLGLSTVDKSIFGGQTTATTPKPPGT